MGPRFGYRRRFRLLRPLGEDPLAQLTNLLDGFGFRLMRCAALRDQGLNHFGELHQPLPHVGLVRVAFIQTPQFWFRFCRWQFMFHEPL